MFDQVLKEWQQLQKRRKKKELKGHISVFLSPFLHQLFLTNLQVIEVTACSTEHLCDIAGYHTDCLLRWRLPLTATCFETTLYYLLRSSTA